MKLAPDPRVARHRRVAHGGPFSARYRGHILDFSSSINPMGAPTAARFIDPDSLETYPDPDSHALRTAISEYICSPYQNVVVGNGATEIIYNFCRTFVLEDMPVLIPVPTFGEYKAACLLSGARIIHYPTMNQSRYVDGMLPHIPARGCVFICNPNNPTGSLLSKSDMLRLARRALDMETMLFVDECFMELVFDRSESLLPLPEYDNLFVLRSMTKSFALAGARIGYGVGSADAVALLNKIKIPWNVSGLAQKAAQLALSDESYLAQSREMIRREAEYLTERISGIPGFCCVRPSANFILIRTESDSKSIHRRLLRRGILVRDCSSFDGFDGGHNNYIRVAVRSREDNKRLVEELAAV